MGEEAVCVQELVDGKTENTEESRLELKRDYNQCVADTEANVLPNKKQAKEVSNDELRSEVTNPNVSATEHAQTFHDISSQPMESENVSHAECGELTSTGLENSSSHDTVSDEAGDRNNNHGNINNLCQNDKGTCSNDAVSRVVMEIPKHASSTGIRKITFKFSKKKEDYDDYQTPTGYTDGNGSDCGYGYGNGSGYGYGNGSGYGYHGDDEYLANDDYNSGLVESSYGRGYVPYENSELYSGNMELKMSKKVVPNAFPNNVKKLLSTGILDGAAVKYIYNPGKVELDGIIGDGGYLCGCSMCSYSRVLSAYEFEQHAGAKTRHPNNHIFLENGKPIYSIIHEIKTATNSTPDEVIKNVAGSFINEGSFQVWKESLLQSNKKVPTQKKYSTKYTGIPHTYNSQSIESASSFSSSRVRNHFEQQMYVNQTADEWKRVVKKPSTYTYYSGIPQKRSADGCTKKRDNDLHRLLFMPNGLPDGAELAYYVKGQKLLGGYKQGNGIVCGCCDIEISPSQFEAHAGMAARRQPYRHIYASNGLTLHDIALSLANGQNLTTGDSDDMCAVCGDGGDLILCNGCPRAFHAACLGLHSVPESGWHCLNCEDNTGDERGARPIMIRLTRVDKEPEYEVGGCVVCRANDFSVDKFDDRTVIICDQCEKEYHVGCLRDIGLCELEELPKDKWFCCDDCNRIYVALQNSVSAGADTIPSSLSELIIRKHEDRGLCTYGDMNDIQWRILSGKSRYAEHLPLLSRAAAIFRECFDPIVAISGRDLIPVMVYGRNISGQEFGGMYCIVLIVNSIVVSAGLLRIFGRNIAELPLVATSREHQGKGYFQALFSCIERLLSSLNVEKLVLPAAGDAESIWTKKLGFHKMSEDQLTKHLKEVQLTLFNKTSVLEKMVQATE